MQLSCIAEYNKTQLYQYIIQSTLTYNSVIYIYIYIYIYIGIVEYKDNIWHKAEI